MNKCLTRSWRVVKITTCLLIIGSLHISAASLSQTVTLSVKDRSFAEVLLAIQEQTGFFALSSMEVLAKAKSVSIQLKNTPIEESLRVLFQDQPLTYELNGTTILIKEVLVPSSSSLPLRHPERSAAESNGSLLVLAIPQVTGRITDTLGQPLAGASIVVLSPDGKRTSLQTTTNHQGVFTLQHVPEGAMLRISFMGYIEQEVQARAQLYIALKHSESPLDEVQVMAYGTTSRRLSTGNIGTIKSDVIEKQAGITNPLLAIQGRIPGLVITQNTGVPNGGVTVRIQGQNSMSSGSSPLYVVDGVPIESHLPFLGGSLIGNSGPSEVSGGNEGSPLSYLNPSDIESIDVLKDADATAIFGSRGANGVILITTKKGRVGAMQLEVSATTGWGRAPLNGFQMLNTRQYLDMRYEAFRNDGIDWRDPSVDAPDLKLWDTTRNVNWQKELLQGTAFMQNFRAGVSGGSVGVQYRLAGTYNKSSSLFPDNGNGNPAASLNASINGTSANQKFRIGWTANYQHNHSELPANNFLQAAWLLPPHAPEPFNADGTLNWAPDANGNSTYLLNPFLGMTQVHTNTTTNLISNLDLGYKVWRNLELRANFGYNNMLTDNFIPYPSSAVQPEFRSSYQNQADYGNRSLRSWVIEPQLHYKKATAFGRFDALLGHTLRESTTDLKMLSGYDYPSDVLLSNMGSAARLATSFGLGTQYKYMAYFGRLNYNLDDQLILNFNARRDGSSRFGANKRFANFWSVSGGWIFTNQHLIKESLPWLSFGKLRMSYGVTGNDQIGDFRFIRTYFNYPLQVPYQGIAALQSTSLPNPDLVWERVNKSSTGLDLGFLHDRILLTVNYAQNTSGNQLQSYLLSTVTGSSAINWNWDATVRNTTWEFGLNTINIKSKVMEWSTNFNLSLARNILVDYPDFDRSPYAQRYVIGEPLDILRVVRFGGLNASTGEYQFLDKNANPTTYPSSPDDYVFRSFFPTVYGGLQNTVRWKRISFDVFVQFTKKYGASLDYYNGYGTITPGVFMASGGGNQPVSVLNRWQQPGEQAHVAKYSSILWGSASNIAYSDAWFRDASFARLKNASLTWQFPSAWGKRLGLQSASLTVSGQNLFTLTNFEGPDPETESLTALPPLRMLTVGVQVVF